MFGLKLNQIKSLQIAGQLEINQSSIKKSHALNTNYLCERIIHKIKSMWRKLKLVKLENDNTPDNTSFNFLK